MSISKTRSGRYRCRVKSHGTVVADQTFDRKTDATAFETEQKRQLQTGTWISPKLSSTLLETVAANFIEYRRKTVGEHTWDTEEAHLRLHILPVLGKKQLNQVTKADLLDCLVDVMAKRTRRTALRVRDTLVAFYGYAAERKVVDRNIAQETTLPDGPNQTVKPSRPFTRTQLSIMLETHRSNSDSYADVIEFLVETGLRWGEVRRLEAGDIVRTPNPSIIVSRSQSEGYKVKPPKNGRTRRVPLSRRAQELLAVHAAGKGPAAVIFAAPGGGLLNSGNFKRKLRWKETSFGHRVHDLRHTAGAFWILKGIHIDVVSKWLGHSSVRITQEVYVDVLSAAGEDNSIALMNIELS